MATTARRVTGSEGYEMAATMMKAIIQDRYGSPDNLELREIEKPAVGEDGVLVRVRAASVNPADWRPMRGKPYLLRLFVGLRKPKSSLTGADVAGVVEAVGKDVTKFRPGDDVFGVCPGAFAEYGRGREKNLVPKPASITFEQAAAIPIAGVTALQALRDHGQLQPGQRVLINGAAGGVGTFAVQIAKALGGHVTGVTSGRNVEMVRSLGADQVIDYTQADFARAGERYDLVVDNVGNRALRHLRRALTPKGTLVVVGAKNSTWMLRLFSLPIKAKLVSPFVGQRMIFFIAKIRADDLTFLSELIEAGKVSPVIDRTYPLSEVSEAIRYVETLHARAKVVITV
jgi:NADPH:quinone reductase-like Zn-dependent oxidoreductase